MTTPAPAPAPPAVPGRAPGRGLLLVCLAGVLWGTIGPAVPLAVEASGLSPLTVGALRGVVAAVVLLAAVASAGRLRRCWVLARPQWRRVVAVGVLTATFQQLFFVAVIWAGVSITTVVCLGFAPALLLVVGSVRTRRPPAPAAMLTVTVAVVGLLLVSVVGSEGPAGPRPLLGVLAALGAGAAYGFSAEAGAPLSRRLDTLTMTTATMVVAAGVLLPLGLGLPLLAGEPVWTTDPASWAWIVYLGVVTMAVAYALLFTGLRTTSSGTAVVASLLEPVTAVLLAVTFLGERLTPAGVLGSALILLAIATLGRRAEEPMPQ